MPDSLELYDTVSERLREIFVAKNTDYGDTFREDGILGILVREKDKLSRLINLIRKGGEGMVLDEKIEDTLNDLANYAIMGRICLHPCPKCGKSTQECQSITYTPVYVCQKCGRHKPKE